MKRKTQHKTCLFCKIQFSTLREVAKYCSVKCRMSAQSTELNLQRKRKEIKCKNCNKKVELHAYEKTIFCSKDCGFDFRRKNPIRISDDKKRKKSVVCKKCNTEFRVWNYRQNVQYCSRKCKHEDSAELLICKTCGVQYSIPKHRTSGRKFCSLECAERGCEKRKSLFWCEVEKFLIKNNIKHFTEECIHLPNRRISADFLLDNNIVLECNGDYWHCNPIKYEKNYFHKQIRKTAEQIWHRDAQRIADLESNGFTVVAVWECDWTNDPHFFNKLLNTITYEVFKN